MFRLYYAHFISMYRNENMVYNAISIAGVRVLLSVIENQQLIITVKLLQIFTVIFRFRARKYININIYLRVYVRLLIKFKNVNL